MSNSVIKPLTKEELDKISLAPEAITHYSQEDELKGLLFERELYKRMYEEQQKSIDTFAQHFDNIMSTPIHTSHGIKSLREHVQQETFKYKLDQLTKINFDCKIEKDTYFTKYPDILCIFDKKY
jgi:hypothetical protein